MKKHFFRAVALALFFVGAPIGVAYAHSQLLSSSISDGATIAAPPAQITLTFNEPTRVASLQLLNSTGAAVPLRFQPTRRASATLTQALPTLAPGAYRLTWNAMGPDGHAMQGVLRFTVGAPQAAALAPSAPKPAAQQPSMSMPAGMDHSAQGGSMSATTSIADGAILTTRPTSVTITFGHPMRLSSATLTTIAGDRLPVRFSAPAPSNQTTISFDALQADRYTLSWSADAGGHQMSGTVRFQVR